jgi:four helix bundle protein
MPKSTATRIGSYRDLDVWQLAMDIVIEIYRVTRAFPAEERFGLIAQLRRAAVAIPSNIAEGHNRLGSGEFRRFVSIARGSVAEVETQITVAVALGFVGADEVASLSSQLDRLSKMLFGLYRRLAPDAARRPPPVARRPSPVARRPSPAAH